MFVDFSFIYHTHDGRFHSHRKYRPKRNTDVWFFSHAIPRCLSRKWRHNSPMVLWSDWLTTNIIMHTSDKGIAMPMLSAIYICQWSRCNLICDCTQNVFFFFPLAILLLNCRDWLKRYHFGFVRARERIIRRDAETLPLNAWFSRCDGRSSQTCFVDNFSVRARARVCLCVWT